MLTPSSVSEQKVPTANLAQILVSPEGKVFISIAGDADAETKDTWGSEALRKTILDEAVTLYNKQHPSNQVQLTAQDREAFSKINMFGVPFQVLHQFLSMSQTDQDKFISDMSQKGVGIPVNDNKDMEHLNEFQIWMRAIYNSGNDNLQKTMKKGEGIAVKADKDTPYDVVQDVLDNLQTLKMNRFSIMTALKTEQE